jgi:hypothetical protein
MADNPITDDNNVVLYDDEGNKVDVNLIFGVYRLATDTVLTGGNFQLQPFVPEFHYSVAGTALNTSTETVLFTESSVGKIDFISIAGSNSNYEVILEVDTVEVLRITMADLGSGLGLANATNVPIWVETANKNFRYSPKQGVDFTSQFTLSAIATANPAGTVNWLINDRKEAP